MKKYYKHTYQVVVLSENPDPDNLEDLNYNVEQGGDVLYSFNHSSMEEMNEEQISKELYEAGSEPGFFGIKEETVTLTIGEIFNRAKHPGDCGLNEWCLAEGLAEASDPYTIDKIQALSFMGEEEFESRKNIS